MKFDYSYSAFVLRFLLLGRPFSVSAGENCLALMQRMVTHMKNMTNNTSITARTTAPTDIDTPRTRPSGKAACEKATMKYSNNEVKQQ